MPDPLPLRARLLDHIRHHAYQPENKSELARALNLHPDERQQLRQILATLVADGQLVQARRGRFSLPGRTPGARTLVGTIAFQPKGHAFLIPDDPADPRVFIPSRATGTALPGDRVSVQLEADAGAPLHPARRGRRGAPAAALPDMPPRGRVSRIVERSHKKVVGTLQKKGSFLYLLPDDPRFPSTIELSLADDPPPGAAADDARHGLKAVAAITRWESRSSCPSGELVQVLGPPGAPGVDMLSIIHAFDLPLEFPPAVQAEADLVPDHVRPEDVEGREDWRDHTVITIDPEDARDFDDAIALSPLPDGGWKLAVHIADVSHYVRPRSPLDREARLRGNSTYLPDRVIPMLPFSLSAGICSLVPHQDRLTRMVEIKFSPDGQALHARFASAVIRSTHRYSYEEAYAILIEPPRASDPPHVTLIHEAWKLAAVLRRRRFEHGSLDLDFPEVKAVLDADGRAVGLRRIEHDESHQLIEEFMIAANEAVGKATREKGLASVYRIHEDPDEGKLFEFHTLARSYGYSTGDPTEPGQLRELLAAVKGSPEEHAIKLALLKSLKRACYSHQPLGHFGLAKRDYTHFTSPIRRYADLIVHRALFPPTDAPRVKVTEAEEAARHISQTERASADAENESQRLKQLEYLRDVAKDNPDLTFAAVIQDIRPPGLFVELSEYFIRGMVKREDLPHHIHVNRPGGGRRRARPRFKETPSLFQIGQELEVAILNVDLANKFVDFRIVEGS